MALTPTQKAIQARERRTRAANKKAGRTSAPATPTPEAEAAEKAEQKD